MILTVNIKTTDFETLSNLSVDAYGIKVGESENESPTNSFVVNDVDNFSSLDIKIEQENYIPYSTTIENVYDEDKTIDITLIPIVTDIDSPNYGKSYPTFFTFNSKCSFCINYYYASSTYGNVSWFVNNELYKTGLTGSVTFSDPGSYQLKVRNQSSATATEGIEGQDGCGCAGTDERGPSSTTVEYSWVQYFANQLVRNDDAGIFHPEETYLSMDPETNIEVKEYRIDISYELVGEITDQIDEKTSCYAIGSDVIVKPSISTSREDTVLSDVSVSYRLFNPIGERIFDETFTLEDGVIDWPIRITEIGDYVANITVIDEYCNNTYEEKILIRGCNFISIDYVDCSEYKISNKSVDRDVDFTLKEVLTGSETQFTVTSSSSYDLTIEEVSLYTLTATYYNDSNEISNEFIINNYCSIDYCFAKYIENLICFDGGECNDCPPSTELNQMLFFYNTYFMKMNKILATHVYDSAMEDTTLDDLVSAKNMMDKIEEYCNRLSCLNGNSGSFNQYGSTQNQAWSTNTKNCCGSPSISMSGTCKTCGS